MFRKILDDGEAGDNTGLLLRGVDKERSEEVWLSANLVQITPHTSFQS
jgi:elongation factor Tu